MSPVTLALTIALISVLGFTLMVFIVLFCVYHKSIAEAAKPIKFDNEKHSAEKKAEAESNDEKSDEKELPKLKSFKD